MRKLAILSIALLLVFLSVAVIAMPGNNGSGSNKVEVPVDSIEILSKNPNFQEHAFQVKELTDNTVVSREEAIQKARTDAGSESQQAKKISAMKVKFTDNETPRLPEKEIILKDYPVWIVTFHGVDISRNGPGFRLDNTGASNTVFCDMNVVIDAKTGETLEIFSYPSMIK